MSSIYMEESKKIVMENPQLSLWKIWTAEDVERFRLHRGFYRSIISYTGQNSFQESLKAFYRENMLRQIRKDFADG